MHAKRQNAYMLALLVFFFSVFPAKRSEAVIPIAIGLSLQALGSGGAVVSSDLLIGAATALIGGAVMALIFSIPGDVNQSVPVSQIRVPTTTNQASTDLIMPPPPAASTSTPTVQGGVTWNGAGTSYSDIAAACAAYVVASGYSGANYVCVDQQEGDFCMPNSPNCHVYDTNDGSYLDLFPHVTATTTCPGGYTASGSSCNLSNARAAVTDGKVDLTRGASGYTNTDKDSSAAADFSKTANGETQVWGKDSQGNPMVATVKPDGVNTRLTVQKQVASADGQSTVKSDNYIINNSTGAVTAVGSGTTSGTIALPDTAAGSPAVTSGAAVNPVAATGSGTGTGTGDIVFPSDYARSGEAVNAANIVKTAVNAVGDKLTNSVDVSDPTAPDYVDPWGVTFGALKGWSLPGHTSTCPVGSFGWNNQTFQFDAHCQLVSDHFGVLQAAMSVVWVVLALFVVLGA